MFDLINRDKNIKKIIHSYNNFKVNLYIFKTRGIEGIYH